MEASKLASYVASRLCHDLAAPLTPLMQSCEMLFDDSMGAAMKAEGEKALKQAIATLEAKLRFLRFALGSQALNDGQANLHELKDMFLKLFAVNSKTQLEWRIDTSRISNRQARAATKAYLKRHLGLKLTDAELRSLPSQEPAEVTA